MGIGPIHLVVVGFDRPELKGEVVDELIKVRQKGTIRLIDLLFVYRDPKGELRSVEVTDFSLAERMELGAVVGGLIGLGAAGAEGARAGAEIGALSVTENDFGATPEQVGQIADRIPNDSAALIMLFEHTWATRLRDAILNAGGVPLAQSVVSPAALIRVGAELAAAAEKAERVGI